MQVERYERYWMWAATGMLVAVHRAPSSPRPLAGSAHPPSHTETVNPETLTVAASSPLPAS